MSKGFKKTNHVYMIGAVGSQKVLIDPLLKQQVDYYTLVNLTDNRVGIYPMFANIDIDYPAIKIGQYQTISLPISDMFREGFIVKWDAVTDLTIPKKLDVIFSENDLQQNNSYAPSFMDDGVTSKIVIDKDNVGLVKASQLPLILGIGGGLEVEIIGTVDTNNYADNFQVDTGLVDTPLVLTQSGVIAKNNYITGFDLVTIGAISGTDILIELKDSVNVIHRNIIPVGSAVGTVFVREFSHALKGGVNSDITLNIGAGGAGCFVVANMSGFTK